MGIEGQPLFGRRPPIPSIQLDSLIGRFGQAAGFWESQPQPEVLVRARLADAFRDLKLQPIPRSEFQDLWNHFDDEQRLRFCILVDGLEIPEFPAVVQKQGPQVGRASNLVLPLVNLNVQLQYLTCAVLRESDIRLEEFSRHFCAKWELSIHGETPAASSARLHEIDFGRLMQEANAARASAEERLAYLRTLQEEQEKTRRPRRGKW